MTSTKNKTITAVAGLLAILAAGVLLYRHRPTNDYVTENEIAAARTSARTFTELPTLDASRTDALSSEIAESAEFPEQVIGAEVTDEQRAAFAHTIATWIGYRATLDAEGFAEWMRSRGCTLAIESVPDEELRRILRRSIREARYEHYVGAPMPPDLTAEEYHAAMFSATLKYANDLFRPVAIAADDGASHFFTRVRSAEGPAYESWAGMELWRSSTTGGGEPHWLPPASLQNVIDRDGSALFGTALLGVLGGNQRWHSLLIHLYWDPERSLWHFYWINHGHVTEPTGGLGVF